MKYFCNELKEIFVKSLTEAKEKLNSKNIVKLVERKDRKKNIHSKVETHFFIEGRFF